LRSGFGISVVFAAVTTGTPGGARNTNARRSLSARSSRGARQPTVQVLAELEPMISACTPVCRLPPCRLGPAVAVRRRDLGGLDLPIKVRCSQISQGDSVRITLTVTRGSLLCSAAPKRDSGVFHSAVVSGGEVSHESGVELGRQRRPCWPERQNRPGG
jgi:hypothetical protein